MENKKVGNLTCDDISCAKCPLRALSCRFISGKSLYEILDLTEADTDQEVYDLMKSRLAKEVNQL